MPIFASPNPEVKKDGKHVQLVRRPPQGAANNCGYPANVSGAPVMTRGVGNGGDGACCGASTQSPHQLTPSSYDSTRALKRINPGHVSEVSEGSANKGVKGAREILEGSGGVITTVIQEKMRFAVVFFFLFYEFYGVASEAYPGKFMKGTPTD